MGQSHLHVVLGALGSLHLSTHAQSMHCEIVPPEARMKLDYAQTRESRGGTWRFIVGYAYVDQSFGISLSYLDLDLGLRVCRRSLL